MHRAIGVGGGRPFGVRERAAFAAKARVLAVAVDLVRARFAWHRLGRARARALVAQLLARRVAAAVRAHRHHVVVAGRPATLAARAHRILALLFVHASARSVVVVIPAVLPRHFLGDAYGVFEVLVGRAHGRALPALLIYVVGFISIQKSRPSGAAGALPRSIGTPPVFLVRATAGGTVGDPLVVVRVIVHRAIGVGGGGPFGVRERAAFSAKARVLAVAVDLVRARFARHRLGRARARALVAQLLARWVAAAVRAHRHHVVVAGRPATLAARAHRILALLFVHASARSVVVVIPAVLPRHFLGDAHEVFEVLIGRAHGRALPALLVYVVGFISSQQSIPSGAAGALPRVWVLPERVRIALVATRRCNLLYPAHQEAHPEQEPYMSLEHSYSSGDANEGGESEVRTTKRLGGEEDS